MFPRRKHALLSAMPIAASPRKRRRASNGDLSPADRQAATLRANGLRKPSDPSPASQVRLGLHCALHPPGFSQPSGPENSDCCSEGQNHLGQAHGRRDPGLDNRSVQGKRRVNRVRLAMGSGAPDDFDYQAATTRSPSPSVELEAGHHPEAVQEPPVRRTKRKPGRLMGGRASPCVAVPVMTPR